MTVPGQETHEFETPSGGDGADRVAPATDREAGDSGATGREDPDLDAIGDNHMPEDLRQAERGEDVDDEDSGGLGR